MIIRKAKEETGVVYGQMKQVHLEMKESAHFILDDPDFIGKQLSSEGFGVLAWEEEGDVLAGSVILRYPRLAQDNLGREIGLSQECLPRVAHVETAVVGKEFRGMGLQGKMIQYAMQELEEQIQYIMATVAPDNWASKKTFLKLGFEICMTKEKYGGVQRDILCLKQKK